MSLTCINNGCLVEQGEDVAQHKKAEELLAQAKKELKQVRSCLLLGTGDSGKSTVLKQMQMLHKNGFTDSERGFFLPNVIMNIIEGITVLVDHITESQKELENPVNMKFCEDFKQEYPYVQPQSAIKSHLIPRIKVFIADATVKKLTLEPEGFYLPSSTKYYFDEFDRITSENWVPSDDDILRCRKPTQGVNQVDFDIGRGGVIIRLIDVGGQKTERKKWIHFFENVTTVIFCASLPDYDVPLMEDPSKNRMIDSMEVFEAVVNSRWFIRSSMVLFLNKTDLFTAKISHVPLNKTFPEYICAEPSSPKQASTYIAQMYKKRNKANIRIFTHITTATDTKSFRSVLQAVMASILDSNQPNTI